MAEKAQVGDLIRVVDDCEAYGAYVSGDILEVEKIDDDSVYVKGRYFDEGEWLLGGDKAYLVSGEYVIHRKAGEEDAPCDDFIVDGCLFQTKSGEVRKAERVTDDWVYADDGERYKRMFVERITDVSVYDGYALMEEAKLREKIHELAQEQCSDETQADAVSHPSHYTQGRFETIEIIEEITQGYSDGFVATCVGNAIKYLARAPFKHESPAEDIDKAAKYLAFASERLAKGER